MYANAQNTDPGKYTIHALMVDSKKDGIDMNQDRFQGIWKQFSGTVMEKWGTLTDNPRTVAAGVHDRFAGRLQEQRGISKQEADRQLEDFMIRNRDWQNL